jgi:hypothetical protein
MTEPRAPEGFVEELSGTIIATLARHGHGCDNLLAGELVRAVLDLVERCRSRSEAAKPSSPR